MIQRVVALLSVVFVGFAFSLTGCGKKDESKQQPRTYERIDRGAPVTMVSEEGNVAKVRIGDGREIYVPLSTLKQRSSLDDGTHSHTLSAPVEALAEAPVGPIELPPQSKIELIVEQQSMNRVFITESSKRQIIAPGNSQPTYEGEKCWAAYMCNNPECPAKDQGENGRPFLFINNRHQAGARCPACLPLWEEHADDEEVAARYRAFARLYELPEAVRRQKAIDEIRKREREARRAKRKAAAANQVGE